MVDKNLKCIFYCSLCCPQEYYKCQIHFTVIDIQVGKTWMTYYATQIIFMESL